MKILYHHRIRSRDGQYVHVSEMIHSLSKFGHEVTIIGPQIVDNAAEGLGAGWVARFKKRAPRALYEILELAYSFYDLPRLLLAIRSHRPDVIYERYNLFFLSGIWAHKLMSVPLLLEVNAPLALERAQHDGLGLPKFAERVEAYTWRNADIVLPVTGVLGEMIRKKGVDEDRIHAITNGVDPDVFSSGGVQMIFGERRRLDESISVGFVGYLRQWHRLDRVIKLLAREENRHTRFVIVGDGPARSELERYAAELGVADRVFFVGVLDREALPRHICRFDIALQPSVVDYASPLKLQEYMAMGCAIVAPDKPNIREVLDHEENALLFDPEDDESFERAVQRLCSDNALRDRVGRDAAATITRKGLTWDSNARRIVHLAKSLVSRES